MQNKIKILFKAGFFLSIDYFFAVTLMEIAKEDDPIVAMTAALISRFSRNGHLCIDMNKTAGKSVILTDFNTIPKDLLINQKDYKKLIDIKLPLITNWENALKKSSVVGDNTDYPIVLDQNKKIFLAKYYDFQTRTVQNIKKRVGLLKPDVSASALEYELDKIFIDKNIPCSPDQRAGYIKQKNAVKMAVKNNFLIITGGPGTGKTYITDKIAYILKKLSLSHSIDIVNTAPTGKAASKLEHGLTIHRLLGINKEKAYEHRTMQGYITADLVIIDEASMIDIALMTKLMEAIPIKARVIIMGDDNQLGSIGAGSVFSDICRSDSLKNYIVNLEYNFRSGSEKGLNKLAHAVRTGDEKRVEQIISSVKSGTYEDITFIDMKNPLEALPRLKSIIKTGYAPVLLENDINAAFEKLEDFKILCCHKKTDFGSAGLNTMTEKMAEKILHSNKIHDIKNSLIRSILMITKNDYNKSLFNGDIGMLVKQSSEYKAVFMDQNSSLKYYNRSELKTHEVAFAITVHKSQGSEFDHVLLILPPELTMVMNRKLIYTAITRARKKLTIAGTLKVLKKAVSIDSQRESGITGLLDKEISLNGPQRLS